MDWLLSAVSSVSTFLVASVMGAFSLNVIEPAYTTFPVTYMNNVEAEENLMPSSISTDVINATSSSRDIAVPVVTYIIDGNGVTQSEWHNYQDYTERRFVGSLIYTNLLHKQAEDSGRVARLEKQIFSLMDDTSESLQEIRDDMSDSDDVDVSTLTGSTLISPIFAGAIGSNLTLGNYYLSGDGDDEGISIDGSGRVGIGTTTPQDSLSLASGAIYLDDYTPAVTNNRIYASGGNLYWGSTLLAGGVTGTWDSNGTDVYRLTGNVGVGTSTPSQLLTVGNNNQFTVNSSGAVDATSLTLDTPLADAYITKTGAWTGTFDGQEGVYYLDRSNHTGTQTASTISDFSGTARGLLSSAAPGLTYTSGTGVFSLTAGYNIPLTASTSNWNTAYAWGNHASAGYITDGNTGWDNTYGFITSADDTVSGTELDGVFSTTGLLFRNGAGSYSTLATSTLAISILNTTGTLDAIRGGTGISSYSVGDLLYASGTSTLTTRAIGSSGQVLQVVAGVPTWVATSSLGITGGGSSFTNSSELAALLSDETGTGYSVFSDAPTFTGVISINDIQISASSTNHSIAIGEFAGQFLSDISLNNIAIGNEAGRYASGSSAYNNFIGLSAGSNSAGSNNNFLGTVGEYNVGSNNNFFGQGTGLWNVGDENNAIGTDSGESSTGSFNNLFGRWAGRYNNGDKNNFIGYEVGVNNIGSSNNFIGNGAGLDNLGSLNIIIGTEAGFENNGSSSILLGNGAGYSNIGDYNTIAGEMAGYRNFGSENNIFGSYAGYENSGSNNNIQGTDAGYSNTGSLNNIFGNGAGYINSGSFNNLLGVVAGHHNLGSHNNLLGYGAGYFNIGSFNNFLGSYAGYNNSGSYSEFIGFETGGRMSASSTIAIGALSLRGGSGDIGDGNAATTTNNIAIGYGAGYNVLTGGNNNILLGYQAADSLTTGANNIIIGYDVEAPSNTASNQLNIGNLLFGTGINGTGTTLSSGNIGIGTTSPASKLDVWGDFRVGTTSSSTLFASSGKVGIGTTTPSDQLTIVGDQRLVAANGSKGYRFYTSGALLDVAGAGSSMVFSVFANANFSGGQRYYLNMSNATHALAARGDWYFNQGDNANGYSSGTTTMLVSNTLGLVGIGTTSPASKLDVWGDFRVGTTSSSTLFASSGSVGIGTTTPLSALHVVGGEIRLDSSTNRLFSTLGQSGNGIARLFESGGNIAVQLNANGVSYLNGGNLGIGTSTPQSSLHVVGADIRLDSTGSLFHALGQSGNGIVRLFDSDGNVDVQVHASGTTYFNGGSVGIGTSTPADLLQVLGDIRVGTSTTGCVKDADGTVIAGTCSSDERLKRDILTLGSSSKSYLEAMTALEPSTFRWNNLAANVFQYGTDELQTGLIAQQVELTMPELVTEDYRGYKQVRFSELPIYLLQAIKEMWQIVRGHGERLDELEAENANLKARIERLEGSSDAGDENVNGAEEENPVDGGVVEENNDSASGAEEGIENVVTPEEVAGDQGSVDTTVTSETDTETVVSEGTI